MIKLKSLLKEIISDIVWHLTIPFYANSILRQDKFILSKYNKKYSEWYTLSVSRSPGGGFYDNMGGIGNEYHVMFELDGRKLSNNYKGSAYNDFSTSPNGSALAPDTNDEMEDIILSKKDTIPNASKYIKAAHLLMVQPLLFPDTPKNTLDTDLTDFVDFIVLCRRKNIPLFYYDTETRFRSARGGKQFNGKSEWIQSMQDKMQLNENLYTMNKSVEYVYKHGGFAQFIIELNSAIKNNSQGSLQKAKETYPYYYTIMDSSYPTYLSNFETSKLPDEACIMANNLNPCMIYCGIFKEGNYYKPNNKEIYVSVLFPAIKALYTAITMESALRTIPSKYHAAFKNEITGNRIRASIAHELSHWIDDSVHNNMINNELEHLRKFKYNSLRRAFGVPDINMTYFEIQAQIHGIAELRRKNIKKWDSMTLADLFKLYTSLFQVYEDVAEFGPEYAKLWQTNLVRRMAREGILGKNMRTFVKY